MHELSITRNILEIVAEHAHGATVTRVVLEIGKLSAVLPHALRFCFELCRKDTVADGAELVIIETPGLARCRNCEADVKLDQPFGQCGCGSTDLEWMAGEELKVKEIEVT
jgi:hydrogenase nickel incorporation protein HypA/HybF